MNMLMRIRTLTVAGAIAAIAGAVPAHAQGGGTDAFKWYVGGHGGVESFRTTVQDRKFIPVAGAHMLITAKRTGLLLSVDQAFGSDEVTTGAYQITDTTGVHSGNTTFTFKGIRKYSAVLLAYPVRNRNVQPFVGLGVGLIHLTTTVASPSSWADNAVESTLGSSGFGTGVAGLEFRVGPVSAFGMWQVTTKMGYKQFTRAGTESDGTAFSRTDFGELLPGATHTIVGGLRFSLGSAREPYNTDGD